MSEDREKTNPLALRTAYEVEGLSVGEIAKKFGVSSPYVSKIKKRDGWQEPNVRPKTAVTEAVTATVTEITRAATERRRADIERAADELLNEHIEGLADHAAFAADGLAAARALVNKLTGAIANAPATKLRGLAETLKVAVEAGDKAGRFERDARGIRTGEPSATPSANDKDWNFTHTVHEAPKAEAS
jgi:DNA-binding MarR family transcriptional regulator